MSIFFDKQLLMEFSGGKKRTVLKNGNILEDRIARFEIDAHPRPGPVLARRVSVQSAVQQNDAALFVIERLVMPMFLYRAIVT